MRDLGLGASVFTLRDRPVALAAFIEGRVKLAARFLGRANGIPHSQALEVVAQAVRFPNWHQLSAHLSDQLSRSAGLAASAARVSWADALSGAAFLLASAKPAVALPLPQVQAFERFGQTLAMLSDAPLQDILDEVCAGLCAGRSWQEVQARQPSEAKGGLYGFTVDHVTADASGNHADSDDAVVSYGYFDEGSECAELIQELDVQWQGYSHFTPAHKRQARNWVQAVLAERPSFLEAGLALASMQHAQGEIEAGATLDRFIAQAEALIPAGFKGTIPWSRLDNRFYHRMMWQRLQISYDYGDLAAALRLARKQLKLNPDDNLGVRYILPLLQLQLGEYAAAWRSTARYLGDEPGLLASAIRAFCAHAVGDKAGFRGDLAASLFTLPWMRIFLLKQEAPLPDGDIGFRGTQPDLETFIEFAWPAYIDIPGLRDSCAAFLQEPDVLQAEAELRQYWKGFWRRDGQQVGSLDGWRALCERWLRQVSSRPKAH